MAWTRNDAHVLCALAVHICRALRPTISAFSLPACRSIARSLAVQQAQRALGARTAHPSDNMGHAKEGLCPARPKQYNSKVRCVPLVFATSEAWPLRHAEAVLQGRKTMQSTPRAILAMGRVLDG